MKHHFADFLDRTGDYWTIVPNVERYSFSLDSIIEDIENAKIVTITKHDEHWKQVFNLPNLEEITLHEPNKEQLESLNKLKQIKRLRITHARTKSIDVLKMVLLRFVFFNTRCHSQYLNELFYFSKASLNYRYLQKRLQI